MPYSVKIGVYLGSGVPGSDMEAQIRSAGQRMGYKDRGGLSRLFLDAVQYALENEQEFISWIQKNGK